MLELTHLYPIFEFFLALYAGYIVSDEIKKIIDKRVISILKDQTHIIHAVKKELCELIEKTKRDTQTIYASIVQPQNPEESIKAYKDDKFSKLDNLQKEICERYHVEQDKEKETDLDPKNLFILFKSELQFTEIFKPYSLFFSIYCFCMLSLNCNQELLNTKTFYVSLLFFNTLSVIFMGAIFLLSLPKKISIKKWIDKNQVWSTFLIFLIFLAITIHYYGNYPDPELRLINWTVISCIVLVLAPIICYIIRVYPSRLLLKSRLKGERGNYQSRIVIIKDELQKPDVIKAAFAEFNVVINPDQVASSPGPKKKK